MYGDASTGESYWISEDAIPINGKPVKGYLNTSSGQWAGNSYLLPQQRWVDTSPFVSLGFMPLFDPSAKTFRNLLEFVGIPTEFNNEYMSISISPNGDYMWLSRPFYEVGYLVDLKTLKPYAYTSYAEWSANGKFAIIGSQQVLSLSNKELQPLPVNLHPSHNNRFMYGTWHPTKGVRASISINEQQDQTLLLLDVEALSYREVALPSEFHQDDSGTSQILWSPEGTHIALVTVDGSLWEIDYPTLENLEQLTPPMPAVKDVFWSPDGTYLAFVSDKDIYVVAANRKP
jgi:WD40 repeat protein